MSELKGHPMMHTRRLSILLVGVSLLFAAPAFAEPSAADAETALQLYKEGKVLREQGDLPGALAKLRAAYVLVETPITALELGRAYVAGGQLVEAREVLLTVSRMPVRKNESTKAGEARIEADALATELRPRLSSLVMRLKGATDSPPKLTVDGVVVPEGAANVPRVLNPGAHVVVLEANGQRVQTDVKLAEGESRDLELEAPSRPASLGPVVAPPTSSQVVEPPPPPARSTSPLVYVGFGTAIAGVSIGSITGLLTLSKASTLKDACRDTRCPPSSQSDLDSTSTTGTVSTVAFVLGGVGLGVGIVGLLLSKPASEPAHAGLSIVPTVNGVRGSF